MAEGDMEAALAAMDEFVWGDLADPPSEAITRLPEGMSAILFAVL